MTSIRNAPKKIQIQAIDAIFDAMPNVYMDKSELAQLKRGGYNRDYLLEQLHEAIEEAVWDMGYDLNIADDDLDFCWVYDRMEKYIEEFLDSHGIFNEKVRNFYINGKPDTIKSHRVTAPRKNFPRVNVEKMF